MYPEEMVKPMRAELSDAGFQDLYNAEEVKNAIKAEGTTLVVVNSVCGCAAGAARPGVKLALSRTESKPDHLITVFAGQEIEATVQVRKYLAPYPPSSPCIALFKDGKLVHMLERHHIEGHSAEMIAENLNAAFEEFCSIKA